MGIDPGSSCTGYGIIEEINNTLEVVCWGSVKSKPHQPFPQRLKFIYDELITVVQKFNPDEVAIEDMFFSNNVKVPHIGWNTLKQNNKDRILDGVEDQSWAYFVHSLYPKPTDSKIISTTTDYGIEFTSMVNKNNIFGTQFHPEKSGKAGARILENFVSVCGNL